MSGNRARPGPPSRTQSEMAMIAPASSTEPNHVGRPPFRCPLFDGDTTMTFARLHGPRQSLMRRLPTPSVRSRRLASCASWSTFGRFLTVPQQHPRHTVTVGFDLSNATVSRFLSGFRSLSALARRSRRRSSTGIGCACSSTTPGRCSRD